MAFRISQGNAIEQILELGAGYAIGGATGTALEPLLQSLRNHLFSLDPSLPTDPQTLALLVRLGRLDPGAALGEAGKSGVGSDSFVRLVDALAQPPSAGELLALHRRGRLPEGELAGALRRGGLDERYLDAYLDLVREHLSVQDAAMARQQEFIGDQQLHDVADLWGYSHDDADLLFKLAGLPPGIVEGLTLLRRGEIDEERFGRYVAEGHTKTKYTDDLLKLRWTPLSAAVAAEALIRERISEDEAVSIAEKNGLRREDFLTWSHMLGRPPGIMEALTLVNRRKLGPPEGDAAKAFFREVVARSDVRTEYSDHLYELRIHYPPLFQVARAITAGTVTDAVAADTLEKEGYPKEWVAAIVGNGKHAKTAKHRDLAASIIETLYTAGLESHDEADHALETLGYDKGEAEDYLRLWVARRIVAELVHGISLIRNRYTGWKIDRPTAQRELDILSGDPSARERLLPLWDAEREANAPVLTRAEIGEALKYGRYTLEVALEAWQLIGYTAEQALTLAWIVAKGDPARRPAA